MITGFEKLVEERIKESQKKGEFDNLPGSGKPLKLDDDQQIAEDLRLAYKILKNADFKPPELELKKEIRHTEELLEKAGETKEKYRLLKKLNYLILKVNSLRSSTVVFDLPQRYESSLVERFSSGKGDK